MSKVIVVDDIKSYCDSVCEELKEMGIEAVGCYNVRKAKWLIADGTGRTSYAGCGRWGIIRCSS